MTPYRLAIILCAVLVSACATLGRGAFGGDPACARIKELSFDKSGAQYTNPTEAIKVLSECDAKSQNSPAGARAAVLRMRGIAYEQINDYAKAIADSEGALRLRPARTAWDVIGLAALYRKAGQPERALVLLRKNIFDEHLGMTGKGTTLGMPSYYHLGLTLVDLEKWPEAVEAFTEGLTYQPDYAWAYLSRAVAYSGMRDVEHARADLMKGRKLIDAMSSDSRTQAQESLKQEPFATLLAKYPE